MKRLNLNLMLIRLANMHGLPQALAASLLLWGSSCSSTRELARSLHSRPPRTAAADPFEKSAPSSSVQHAHVATKEDQQVTVTQLSVEAPAPATPAAPTLANSTPEIIVAATTATPAKPTPAAVPREFPTSLALSSENPASVSGSSSVPSIQQIAYDDLSAAAQAAVSTPPAPVAAQVPQTSVSPAAPSEVAADPFLASTSAPAATAAPAPPASEAPAPIAAPIFEVSDRPLMETCPPANCPPFAALPGVCPPAVQLPPFMASPGLYQVPAVVVDEYLCDGGDKELPVHYQGRTDSDWTQKIPSLNTATITVKPT